MKNQKSILLSEERLPDGKTKQVFQRGKYEITVISNRPSDEALQNFADILFTIPYKPKCKSNKAERR